MDKLIEMMKKVLADSFAFYLKGHYFHWNVEGADFYQYHGLFDTIYSEVYESIDATAEHIRALDGYAPGSLKRFSELTSIEDETTVPSAVEMASRLLNDNTKVIASLKAAYTQANTLGEDGLANYLQDRMDIHAKHGWMLRASTKRA